MKVGVVARDEDKSVFVEQVYLQERSCLDTFEAVALDHLAQLFSRV